MLDKLIQVNKKFGHLTLIRIIPDKRTETGGLLGEYVCKCGRHLYLSVRDVFMHRILCCNECQKTIDPVGMVFDHLTVLKVCTDIPYKRTIVECKCDCGNKDTIRVVFEALVKRRPISCGCVCPKIKHESLVGKRFSRLLVIDGPIYNHSGRPLLYVCKCDCGGKVCT